MPIKGRKFKCQRYEWSVKKLWTAQLQPCSSCVMDVLTELDAHNVEFLFTVETCWTLYRAPYFYTRSMESGVKTERIPAKWIIVMEVEWVSQPGRTLGREKYNFWSLFLCNAARSQQRVLRRHRLLTGNIIRSVERNRTTFFFFPRDHHDHGLLHQTSHWLQIVSSQSFSQEKGSFF